ncbi:MAG: tetratricopeptide repeat protein, partial [Desulfovibrio sp.]|nr:tetratricopeptide repeat protein [Desulfovibrio sp.]
HLFNEFGINLRKNKMLDQALDYYRRAENLSEADENLHYNIARAFFEKKDLQMCFEYLKKALDLNPELVAAKKFIAYLVEKKLLPDQAMIQAQSLMGGPSQSDRQSGDDPGTITPDNWNS